MRLLSPWALASALVLGSCQPEPVPPPTEAAVAELDRSVQPPLYQLLYDAPLLPAPSASEQRVRLLIWLRHLQLSRSQLARLEELRLVVDERRARIAEAEAQVSARYAAETEEIYGELWALLAEGASTDDPRFGPPTDRLRELRAGGARERELVRVRLEGIRGILEAERDFLRTLSPGQEQLMADSLFFLRHALDPIGQPGTFREIVGTTYDPGQFAVLTRGTGELDHEALDIGGLWADEPDLESHALHGARREVLLFMALLQPGLDEAIAAALPLAEVAPQGTPGTPPPPGGTPPAGSAPAGSPEPAPPGAPLPDGVAPAEPGAPVPEGATPAEPGAAPPWDTPPGDTPEEGPPQP